VSVRVAASVVAIILLAGCGSSDNKSGAAGVASTTSTGGANVANGGTAGTGSAVKLFFNLNGEYKGQLVQGAVVPGSLQCTPITNGGKQGLQVVWAGTVANTGQVSGDMFAGGAASFSFGDHKSQGSASVVVKGDYQNRYGASSELGTGTESVKPDNSGTVDAELDGGSAGKMKLTGSFQC
jgi:hypothetical protein